MVRFLRYQGFDIVITGGTMDSMPVIQATSSSCRVLVTKVAPDGSNENLVRDLATATDRVFIVFRGEVYAQQPVLLTVTNYLWSRSLRKLGLVRRITPVIAVVASTSCNIKQLPWGAFTSDDIAPA
jgi:hypothetical protein